MMRIYFYSFDKLIKKMTTMMTNGSEDVKKDVEEVGNSEQHANRDETASFSSSDDESLNIASLSMDEIITLLNDKYPDNPLVKHLHHLNEENKNAVQVDWDYEFNKLKEKFKENAKKSLSYFNRMDLITLSIEKRDMDLLHFLTEELKMTTDIDRAYGALKECEDFEITKYAITNSIQHIDSTKFKDLIDCLSGKLKANGETIGVVVEQCSPPVKFDMKDYKRFITSAIENDNVAAITYFMKPGCKAIGGCMLKLILSVPINSYHELSGMLHDFIYDKFSRDEFYQLIISIIDEGNIGPYEFTREACQYDDMLYLSDYVGEALKMNHITLAKYMIGEGCYWVPVIETILKHECAEEIMFSIFDAIQFYNPPERSFEKIEDVLNVPEIKASASIREKVATFIEKYKESISHDYERAHANLLTIGEGTFELSKEKLVSIVEKYLTCEYMVCDDESVSVPLKRRLIATEMIPEIVSSDEGEGEGVKLVSESLIKRRKERRENMTYKGHIDDVNKYRLFDIVKSEDMSEIYTRYMMKGGDEIRMRYISEQSSEDEIRLKYITEHLPEDITELGSCYTAKMFVDFVGCVLDEIRTSAGK